MGAGGPRGLAEIISRRCLFEPFSIDVLSAGRLRAPAAGSHDLAPAAARSAAQRSNTYRGYLMSTLLAERKSLASDLVSEMRVTAGADEAGGPDPAEYAIYADALVRHYNGNRAVDNVDLRIEAGEIYGFLGPNGAGKSTTVRMLCTLLAPTGGRALVAGYDIASQPGQVRLRIGVALQEAALDPKQMGNELLRLQGRLYGLSGKDMSRRLTELGELIELGDALDRQIGTYSGGMQRRLDLAAALVHNPQVLFLDEPTTGLDPASRARAWSEIRRLNEELGTTIFLTTQYLEEADELAHRVAIIDRGRIVADGTPGELKRSVGADVIVARVAGDAMAARPLVEALPGVLGVEAHGDELVIATADGAGAISPVAVALAGSNTAVRDLTLRTPTLDDVFLELTGTHIERKNAQEDPS
jgi:ABC-2 type transport system ATP-binding protein